MEHKAGFSGDDDFNANLNKLVRFFSRPDEYGYVFASSSHQGAISRINKLLIETVFGQHKRIVGFFLQTNADISIVEQLRQQIAREEKVDGLIINNLDQCVLGPASVDKQGMPSYFLEELNFSREEIHRLGLPILFWASEATLALLNNQANDLFSQRRMMTVFFKAQVDDFQLQQSFASRFMPEFIDSEAFGALESRILLLKEQLGKAIEIKMSRNRMAREIALPLARDYAEIGLHEQAMLILDEYESDFDRSEPEVLANIAGIYYEAHLYDKAIDCYNQAITAFEYKNRRDVNLCLAYTKLGNVFRKIGNLDQAYENYKKAEQQFIELTNSDPHNESLKYGLAATCGNIGDIYQTQGDFDKALDYFKKFIFLTEELHNNNPRNEEFKHGLAVSYGKLGDIYQAKSNFTKALEYFDKVARLFTELYRGNPRSESIKSGLATAYSKIGHIYHSQGDFDKALDYIKKDNNLAEELYRDNPRNERIKSGLATSYANIGDAYQAKGDFNKALEFFEKDFKLAEELYRDNPRNEKLKNGLALSYAKLGVKYQAQGNFNKAYDYIKKSTELFEEIHGNNPRDKNTNISLAASYSTLAEICQIQGDSNKALDYLKKFTSISEFV